MRTLYVVGLMAGIVFTLAASTRPSAAVIIYPWCANFGGGRSGGAQNCKFHGVDDRKVWLANSFEGMPVPTKDDLGDPDLSGVSYLSIPLEQVKANFQRFGLLDDQVRFIKGWFSDTLPTAPIEKVCILRLDGDHYSSTMDALGALYDKVSPGGFIIIDDYDAFHRAALP